MLPRPEAPPSLTAAPQAAKRIRGGRRSHYAVLGVSDGATAEELKAAFYDKSMALHPDKNQQPEAEAQFAEVLEARGATAVAAPLGLTVRLQAWEVLGQPHLRERYDRSLTGAAPVGAPTTRRTSVRGSGSHGGACLRWAMLAQRCGTSAGQGPLTRPTRSTTLANGAAGRAHHAPGPPSSPLAAHRYKEHYAKAEKRERDRKRRMQKRAERAAEAKRNVGVDTGQLVLGLALFGGLLLALSK